MLSPLKPATTDTIAKLTSTRRVVALDELQWAVQDLIGGRWRNVASVATALAAALVARLAVQVYQPELLPTALRPKPRIQTVEI